MALSHSHPNFSGLSLVESQHVPHKKTGEKEKNMLLPAFPLPAPQLSFTNSIIGCFFFSSCG